MCRIEILHYEVFENIYCVVVNLVKECAYWLLLDFQTKAFHYYSNVCHFKLVFEFGFDPSDLCFCDSCYKQIVNINYHQKNMYFLLEQIHIVVLCALINPNLLGRILSSQTKTLVLVQGHTMLCSISLFLALAHKTMWLLCRPFLQFPHLRRHVFTSM